MGISASVTAAITVAVIENRARPHGPESSSRTLPHGFGGSATDGLFWCRKCLPGVQAREHCNLTSNKIC
jgi:hypothetical protein